MLLYCRNAFCTMGMQKLPQQQSLTLFLFKQPLSVSGSPLRFVSEYPHCRSSWLRLILLETHKWPWLTAVCSRKLYTFYLSLVISFFYASVFLILPYYFSIFICLCNWILAPKMPFQLIYYPPSWSIVRPYYKQSAPLSFISCLPWFICLWTSITPPTPPNCSWKPFRLLFSSFVWKTPSSIVFPPGRGKIMIFGYFY